MNKYAAEKIASEYYNLGVQLALQNPGMAKQANPLSALFNPRALGGASAALLGAGAAKSLNPQLFSKLTVPGEYLAQKGSQGTNQLMEYLSSFKNVGG